VPRADRDSVFRPAAARRHLARLLAWTVRTLRPRRIEPRDPGERIALAHLEAEGWTALEANRRTAAGEFDLLCVDLLGRPILVEVKSAREIRPDALGAPGRRADAAKIRRLAAIAEEIGRETGRIPRIDLVTVRLAPPAGVIGHERGLGLAERAR